MLQLQVSNTAFEHMVKLDVIVKDVNRQYLSPWGTERMFKLRDVAGYLTRVTGEDWTIQNIRYVYSDLIVDLHQSKGIRTLNRITLHDFRSLVLSVDKKLVERFDAKFGIVEKQSL